MGRLETLLKKGFRAAKCLALLNLSIARIKIVRNKRIISVKKTRKEIAQLLKARQESHAYRIKAESLIREQNILAAYDLIEQFCGTVICRIAIIESQRNCPLDVKEAVASLIFAAPRCPDLSELQQVRELFIAKYGKEFAAAAAELRPTSGVNRVIIEMLSTRPATGEMRLKVMKDIAAENKIDWTPEGELLEQSGDLQEGSSHSHPVLDAVTTVWTQDEKSASSRDSESDAFMRTTANDGSVHSRPVTGDARTDLKQDEQEHSGSGDSEEDSVKQHKEENSGSGDFKEDSVKQRIPFLGSFSTGSIHSRPVPGDARTDLKADKEENGSSGDSKEDSVKQGIAQPKLADGVTPPAASEDSFVADGANQSIPSLGSFGAQSKFADSVIRSEQKLEADDVPHAGEDASIEEEEVSHILIDDSPVQDEDPTLKVSDTKEGADPKVGLIPEDMRQNLAGQERITGSDSESESNLHERINSDDNVAPPSASAVLSPSKLDEESSPPLKPVKTIASQDSVKRREYKDFASAAQAAFESAALAAEAAQAAIDLARIYAPPGSTPTVFTLKATNNLPRPNDFKGHPTFQELYQKATVDPAYNEKHVHRPRFDGFEDPDAGAFARGSTVHEKIASSGPVSKTHRIFPKSDEQNPFAAGDEEDDDENESWRANAKSKHRFPEASAGGQETNPTSLWNLKGGANEAELLETSRNEKHLGRPTFDDEEDDQGGHWGYLHDPFARRSAGWEEQKLDRFSKNSSSFPKRYDEQSPFVYDDAERDVKKYGWETGFKAEVTAARRDEKSSYGNKQKGRAEQSPFFEREEDNGGRRFKAEPLIPDKYSSVGSSQQWIQPKTAAGKYDEDDDDDEHDDGANASRFDRINKQKGPIFEDEEDEISRRFKAEPLLPNKQGRVRSSRQGIRPKTAVVEYDEDDDGDSGFERINKQTMIPSKRAEQQGPIFEDEEDKISRRFKADPLIPSKHGSVRSDRHQIRPKTAAVEFDEDDDDGNSGNFERVNKQTMIPSKRAEQQGPFFEDEEDTIRRRFKAEPLIPDKHGSSTRQGIRPKTAVVEYDDDDDGDRDENGSGFERIGKQAMIPPKRAAQRQSFTAEDEDDGGRFKAEVSDKRRVHASRSRAEQRLAFGEDDGTRKQSLGYSEKHNTAQRPYLGGHRENEDDDEQNFGVQMMTSNAQPSAVRRDSFKFSDDPNVRRQKNHSTRRDEQSQEENQEQQQQQQLRHGGAATKVGRKESFGNSDSRRRSRGDGQSQQNYEQHPTKPGHKELKWNSRASEEETEFSPAAVPDPEAAKAAARPQSRRSVIRSPVRTGEQEQQQQQSQQQPERQASMKQPEAQAPPASQSGDESVNESGKKSVDSRPSLKTAVIVPAAAAADEALFYATLPPPSRRSSFRTAEHEQPERQASMKQPEAQAPPASQSVDESGKKSVDSRPSLKKKAVIVPAAADDKALFYATLPPPKRAEARAAPPPPKRAPPPIPAPPPLASAASDPVPVASARRSSSPPPPLQRPAPPPTAPANVSSFKLFPAYSAPPPSSSSSAHTHPKLPDYDALHAQFAALKAKKTAAS